MKNIITNIFGLILWILAILDIYFRDWNIAEVLFLFIIGGVLFLFSNRALKTLLKSIVNKYSDDK